jgi:hypothetical protein
MQTSELQLQQPSLNLEICVDADSCAKELKRCAEEADKASAITQGCGELAITHAWNAGAVCLKAKELLPHGGFQPWLEANAGQRGYHTMLKWMKMAKVDLNQLLGFNPKGLQDAYRIVIHRIEDKPKDGETSEAQEKQSLPWRPLKFSTRMEQWTKEQAMDFIYEFDRAAQFVRSLKVEFGL